MNASSNLRPSTASSRPALSKHEKIRLLNQRLASLQSLYRQTASTFQNIEAELSADLKRYQQGTELIDAAAQIALIWVSLGSLVKDGMRATALQGKALAEANKALEKSALGIAYDPVRDLLLQRWASTIGANDGHIWAFGKIAIQSFFDLTTPSFWAGVAGNLQSGKSWKDAVTDDPKSTVEAALGRIEVQKNQALQQIQMRIHGTQREIAQAQRG